MKQSEMSQTGMAIVHFRNFTTNIFKYFCLPAPTSEQFEPIIPIGEPLGQRCRAANVPKAKDER